MGRPRLWSPPEGERRAIRRRQVEECEVVSRRHRVETRIDFSTWGSTVYYKCIVIVISSVTVYMTKKYLCSMCWASEQS